MSRFYFDENKNCITCNGALVNSGFSHDGEFALCRFDENSSVLFKVPAKPCRAFSKQVDVCSFGGGEYYLTFPVRKARKSDKVILQRECRTGSSVHLLTICEDGNASVETQNEIVLFTFPDMPTDVQFVSVTLREGFLLQITAKIGKRDFLRIYHYTDDYHALLLVTADSIVFDGDDIVCTDYLGGCRQCVCTRRIHYKDGKFCESDRSYSYRKNHEYIDELIPYCALEYLLIGDEYECASLLHRNFTVKRLKYIIGDFDALADFDFCEYSPFVVGVYKKAPYCEVRKFFFTVKDGLIHDVTCCTN